MRAAWRRLRGLCGLRDEVPTQANVNQPSIESPKEPQPKLSDTPSPSPSTSNGESAGPRLVPCYFASAVLRDPNFPNFHTPTAPAVRLEEDQVALHAKPCVYAARSVVGQRFSMASRWALDQDGGGGATDAGAGCRLELS